MNSDSISSPKPVPVPKTRNQAENFRQFPDANPKLSDTNPELSDANPGSNFDTALCGIAAPCVDEHETQPALQVEGDANSAKDHFSSEDQLSPEDQLSTLSSPWRKFWREVYALALELEELELEELELEELELEELELEELELNQEAEKGPKTKRKCREKGKC